jgi:serine/threonine protein kinase/formylglycine-generating enzyme required for sulfatase activity
MKSAGFEPPAEFDDYRVLRPLGKGGMGRVYLGRDLLLDRPVAIKFIDADLPTAQARERFRIEAVALARLQHPNVMAVYRANRVAGRPFIVGELVEGQGLDQVGKPVGGPRLLDIALGLAHGLAAVHQRGVLHRDLKPSNVILTPDDTVKLVDFGIAKLLADAEPPPAGPAAPARAADSLPLRSAARAGDTVSMDGPEGPDDSVRGDAASGPEDGARVAAALTQAGARLGTPSYMAPEVWQGEPATIRSDVYSLGVILYELCSGALPHRADSVAALGLRVTGQDAPPLASVVPTVDAQLAAIIDRCLRRDPQARFPSGVELAAALQEQADRLRLRRRLVWLVPAALGLVVLLSAVGNALVSWGRTRVAVSAHLGRAQAGLAAARAFSASADALRRQALVAFDQRQLADGETIWGRALAATKQAYLAYQAAFQTLDTALQLDPGRADVRRHLAEGLYELALLFDRDHRPEQRDEALARLDSLAAADPHARQIALRGRQPAEVLLKTTPAAARFEVLRFEQDEQGRYSLRPPERSGTTPSHDLKLERGSYLFRITAPGRTQVRAPILLRSGERVELDVYLPAASEVPPGFAYVPAGRFLFGSAHDERFRRHISTVPMHERSTGPYLIARTETTFAEWIDFLNAIPPAQREEHRPHSGEQTSQGGQFGLRATPAGEWTVVLGPTDKQRHSARSGEPIVYQGRDRRTRVDWLRLPVVGVDRADVRAYTDWLAATGKVPGARLCSELEWERAARGADGREYPHGDLLQPDDADFDLTYQQNGLGMGPDEVSAHPASRSPFGVDDLSGNVWEWTASALEADAFVLRGGAYYFDRVTTLAMNREPVGETTRNQRLGLRVCADLPGRTP